MAGGSFGHLVSDKILVGSFLKKYALAGHLNIRIPGWHFFQRKYTYLSFSLVIGRLSVIHTQRFVYTVQEKRNQPKVLYKNGCSEKFHGW